MLGCIALSHRPKFAQKYQVCWTVFYISGPFVPSTLAVSAKIWGVFAERIKSETSEARKFAQLFDKLVESGAFRSVRYIKAQIVDIGTGMTVSYQTWCSLGVNSGQWFQAQLVEPGTDQWHVAQILNIWDDYALMNYTLSGISKSAARFGHYLESAILIDSCASDKVNWGTGRRGCLLWRTLIRKCSAIYPIISKVLSNVI